MVKEAFDGILMIGWGFLNFEGWVEDRRLRREVFLLIEPVDSLAFGDLMEFKDAALFYVENLFPKAADWILGLDSAFNFGVLLACELFRVIICIYVMLLGMAAKTPGPKLA